MMAEVAPTAITEQTQPESDKIVFYGQRRNMAMGVAMLGGGAAAFVAGLTYTFFAEAIAWTFVLWGIFFLYGDLLLATRRLELTDDAMKIVIPLRPWGRSRTWAWKDISRMNVLVHRRDLDQESAIIQIYHQYPGEIALEREDTNYDPGLAQLIMERAHLKPDGQEQVVDLANLPLGQEMLFGWKKR
ncbi:MAG: hypothetical protein KAX65_05465 [Caldilineaceae bacterium]|nr:hypothetical protein [Caldilineaceae bacterium]